MSRRDPKLTLYVMALALAASATVMFALRDYRSQHIPNTANWLKVPCHFEQKGTVWVNRGRGNPTTAAFVHFTYEINGEKLKSDSFDLYGGSTIHDAAGQHAFYTLGADTDVTCYVDPSDHTRAVIYRGESGANDSAARSSMIAAAALGALAVGVLCAAWLRAPRKDEPVAARAPLSRDAAPNLRDVRLKR